MKLGEIIKKYRTDHSMSMAIFSKASGLSTMYISMLERDYNSSTGKGIVPSIPTLKACAKAMGIELVDLIKQLPPEQLINFEDKTNDESVNDGSHKFMTMYFQLPEDQQETINSLIKALHLQAELNGTLVNKNKKAKVRLINNRKAY